MEERQVRSPLQGGFLTGCNERLDARKADIEEDLAITEEGNNVGLNYSKRQ